MASPLSVGSDGSLGDWCPLNFLNRLGSITSLRTGDTFTPDLLLKKISISQKEIVNAGLRTGQRIAIKNNNTIEFFVSLFAIWRLGLVAVPLSEGLPDERVHKICEDLGVSGIFSGAGLYVYPSRSSLQTSSEGMCLIMQSSGSTGLPKYVEFSFENIFNRIDVLYREYGHVMGNSLCLLPTSFGHGLFANCLTPLLRGQNLFLLPKFDLFVASRLAAYIDSAKISFFSTVPAVWNTLRRMNFMSPEGKDLKQVHCASSFLHQSTYAFARSWLKKTPFFINYGLTECGSWVAGSQLPMDPADYKSGFIGGSLGCCISVDATGEILIQSKSIPFKHLDPSGQFHTGDLGYIYNGDLFLTGRRSDFINKGGEKISPFLIEETVLLYEGVQAVVALPLQHDILGEEVGLFIEVEKIQIFNEGKLRIFLKDKLPSSWIPRKIKVLDKLPLLDNGKVDRKVLTSLT